MKYLGLPTLIVGSALSFYAIYRYWFKKNKDENDDVVEVQAERKVNTHPIKITFSALVLENKILDSCRAKQLNILRFDHKPSPNADTLLENLKSDCLNVFVIHTQHVQLHIDLILDYLFKYTSEIYNVLGFNIETIPMTKKSLGNEFPVLLQISTDELCILFRLCKMNSVPKRLLEFLSNPHILKVGTNQEKVYFCALQGTNINGLINVQELAKKARVMHQNLYGPSKMVLCYKKSQYGQTFSDWEDNNIEYHQIDLASRKTFSQVEIFKLLANYLYGLPPSKIINPESMDLMKEFIDQEENFTPLKKYQSPNYIDLKYLYGHDMPGLNILIPKSAEECNDMLKLIKKISGPYTAVGFDCEWMPTFRVGEPRNKVALVQLCLNEEYCVLIRIAIMKTVPFVLKEILLDPKILKVGIVPERDGIFLKEDYNILVNGTLDIRHVAEICGFPPRKMEILAKSILNIDIDKTNKLRLMDWLAETLSNEQIEYAALDAYISLRVLNKLNQIMNTRNKHILKIDPASFANAVFKYHPTKYLTHNIHTLSKNSPQQPRPYTRKTRVAKNHK